GCEFESDHRRSRNDNSRNALAFLRPVGSATVAARGRRLSASLAKTILKYALGLGLLAYVIVRNWEPTGGGLGLAEAFRRPVRPAPVALAALFLAASALITFVRWYILVRAQKLPITLGGAVRLGLVGYFFNSLLHSSVGGDLVNAVAVA